FDERAIHRGEVRLRVEPRLGHAIDDGLWRIIGDEMSRELRRNVSCRLATHREIAQDRLALAHSVVAEAFAQQLLRAGLMENFPEQEFTGLAGVDTQLRKPSPRVLAADRPAGNGLRKRGYVRLRVAAA